MSEQTSGVLETLLPSIGAARFIAEYWNRRPLYLSDGCARASDLGVTLESFLAAIRPPMGAAPVVVKAQYFDAQGAHQEMMLPPSSLPLASELVDAGLTLCVGSYDRLAPPVAALARALAAAIGVPGAVDVACYVSGPGRGFGLHFDDTPIFVIQCDGSKRWRFSSTSVAPSATWSGGVRASEHDEIAGFVRRNPGIRLEVPREEDLETCVLRPHDLLFLPAGTWHRTYADDLSVALTFSLSSRRIDAVLTEAIGRALSAQRVRSVTLRDSPAPVDLASWIAARLPELLAQASALDPRALADAIAPSPPATSREDVADRAVPARGARPAVLRDDAEFLVHHANEAAVFTAPDEHDVLQTFVYLGDDGLQLPAECAAMLQAAGAASRCSLGDLRRWLGPARDVNSIVPALIELGLLEPLP